MVKENQGTKEEPAYIWKMTAPLEGEANDYVLAEQMFSKIISLASDSVVEGKSAALCGLDNPYAIFSVSSDKETYTVKVGNEDGDSRFVSVSGSDGIFKVSQEKISFIDLRYTELRQRGGRCNGKHGNYRYV